MKNAAIVPCLWAAISLATAAGAESPPDVDVGYEIWVELSPETHHIEGRERLTWTNTSRDTIEEMWFQLYWNAFKNTDSVANRQIARETAFGFEGYLPVDVGDDDWGWIEVTRIETTDGEDLTGSITFGDDPGGDQTVMRVELPQALAPGETIELDISFEARVPRNTRRSGRQNDNYMMMQWYPKPGVYQDGRGWVVHRHYPYGEFFADFADFTVHLELPSNFVVGATGTETARYEDAETGTTLYTFEQRAVHDFAWTADTRYIRIEREFKPDDYITADEYREVARVLQLPVEEIRLRPINMILLIQEEHRHLIDRHFEGMVDSIKYYGLWYGPYPYDVVTMLDPPFGSNAGGMEYPTLFTVGTSLFPGINRKPHGLIAHEYGHNYWQGVVANNEFAQPWLDEGVDKYADGKMYEDYYGPLIYQLGVAGLPVSRYTRGYTWHARDFFRAALSLVTILDPVDQPASRFYNSFSYYANTYARGTMVLHTLERIVGSDTMHRILRTYQMRHRYRHVTDQDFIDTVNEVSGRDLTWFFETALRSTATFDYGVEAIAEAPVGTPRGVFGDGDHRRTVTAADAAVADAAADNAAAGGRHAYLVRVRRYGDGVIGGDMKLEVRAVFESGEVKSGTWDGRGRWAELPFEGSSPLQHVVIDPDEVLLLDVNLTNNSRTFETNRGGVFRWMNRALAAIQNALLLVPLAV